MAVSLKTGGRPLRSALDMRLDIAPAGFAGGVPPPRILTPRTIHARASCVTYCNVITLLPIIGEAIACRDPVPILLTP